MHLKLSQKEKKIAKATADLIVTKSLIRLQKSQNLHNRLIQKELEMSIIKKYLKKNTYLQKKDRKLLMI